MIGSGRENALSAWRRVHDAIARALEVCKRPSTHTSGRFESTAQSKSRPLDLRGHAKACQSASKSKILKVNPYPEVAGPGLVEPLEDRTLLSGELSSTLADEAGIGKALTTIAHDGVPRIVSQFSIDSMSQSQTTLFDAGKAHHSVIFVDEEVKDLENLLGAILADNSDNASVETIVVPDDRDGLSFVTEVLRSRSDIDAIQIFSHASPGVLQLGQSAIDYETVLQQRDLVAS